MSVFKDKNDREWMVSLDGPTIRRVRTECDGIDLADGEGKSYDRLVNDPCLLVDVLWSLCRDQAIAAGISDIQFGSALVGDAIERATAAMLESIADFFPQRSRALLTTVAAKNSKVRQLAMEKALAKIEDPELEIQVMQAMDDRMDAEVRSVLTRLRDATDTQELSESPPKV